MRDWYWQRLKDELLSIQSADERTKIEFELVGDNLVLRACTEESTLFARVERKIEFALDESVIQALEDFLLDRKDWEEIRPKALPPADADA